MYVIATVGVVDCSQLTSVQMVQCHTYNRKQSLFLCIVFNLVPDFLESALRHRQLASDSKLISPGLLYN
jgi:hypothetical protein